MLDEAWRVLRPDGLCFARFATTLGMEGLRDGWQRLPDGSDRLLLSPGFVHAWERERDVNPLDPFGVTVTDATVSWEVRSSPTEVSPSTVDSSVITVLPERNATFGSTESKFSS